ncbi:MAG: agmatinase [Chloroflexota bacterium]
MHGLYGSDRRFAALPPELAAYETARAVVLPVPYDATTTFRSGTRDGPRAIVDASMQLELYDIELQQETADVGIHTLPELEPHLGDPEQMVSRVCQAVSSVLQDGKFPLMLGGEHTLTAGAVAACAAVYPDLAILYLDAHADVRGPYLGAKYNHASALRLSLERLGFAEAEDGLPAGGAAPPAVAVGVRSMAAEEAAYIASTRLHVIGADRIAAMRRSGPAALDGLWAETLARLGPPRRPLYVSLDLDAFDPSVVPAVGTPEPGGLDWYEVVSLLRAAASRHPIAMADVMELAPAEGPVASAFTAAKVAYKLIGYALIGAHPRPLR